MRRSHTAGFTLIEMTVVITVLALMAALVAPNLVAFQRSRTARDREAALLRLPAEARDEARRSKTPETIRVEGNVLVLERTPVEGDPQEVKRVTLSETLSLERVQQGGESLDPASWKWMVYPDGSASPARLDFQDGTTSRSLLLSADGDARWAAPGETDATEERWNVGEIEHRG